ncbi:MAG: ABC transporter substrate-binding protein [Candidatus Dormiibacterota bacterium]
MRSFQSFAALLSVVMLAGACGGTSTPTTSGGITSIKLMVGGLNKQIYLPNMLAQRLGYFKAENLNVTLIDEGSGQASEEEVVAGNVDAGSGAYTHPMVLNTLGKKIETICQFGIAPGEAEVVDASLTNITGPKDLAGKNLGVTDIGSGTHVLTQAILGTAGVDPKNAKYVAVGAGDTFIAAIQQKKIAAGMTTFPTISRLVNSGKGKILVSLLTPADTRAALGGDYPFIGIFAKNDWVNSNKDVAQRLVNAYVKTLKYIHSHTAAEIADQMPADYYAGDKASYIADLNSQLSIFGTDCRMPAGGPETVQKIAQQFVSSYKGKSANLSETYTNEFADKAS